MPVVPAISTVITDHYYKLFQKERHYYRLKLCRYRADYVNPAYPPNRRPSSAWVWL